MTIAQQFPWGSVCVWCWGWGSLAQGEDPLQPGLDSRGVWEWGKADKAVYLCWIWVAS